MNQVEMTRPQVFNVLMFSAVRPQQIVGYNRRFGKVQIEPERVTVWTKGDAEGRDDFEDRLRHAFGGLVWIIYSLMKPLILEEVPKVVEMDPIQMKCLQCPQRRLLAVMLPNGRWQCLQPLAEEGHEPSLQILTTGEVSLSGFGQMLAAIEHVSGRPIPEVDMKARRPGIPDWIVYVVLLSIAGLLFLWLYFSTGSREQ